MLNLTPELEKQINEYGFKVDGCFGDLLLEDTPEGVRVSLTDEMAEDEPSEAKAPEVLFTIKLPGLTAENAWDHIGGILMAVEIFCWQAGDNRIEPSEDDSEMVKALIEFHTAEEMDRSDSLNALVRLLIDMESNAAYHLLAVISGDSDTPPPNYGDLAETISATEVSYLRACVAAERLSEPIFTERGKKLMDSETS